MSTSYTIISINKQPKHKQKTFKQQNIINVKNDKKNNNKIGDATTNVVNTVINRSNTTTLT